MAKKIPADTAWFHYHDENPKQHRAGDCVVRAIARATGETWDDVYDALCEEGRKRRRMPNEREAYEAYLKRLGWVRKKQPKHWRDGRKYTGREFAEANDAGNVIMHIGTHHMSCIVDGRVNDTWDCTAWCVGVYWVKEI